MRRLAAVPALLLAVLLQSACTKELALRQDFYSQNGGSRPYHLPYRISIVPNDRSAYVIDDVIWGATCMLVDLKLDTYPALINATRTELASVSEGVDDSRNLGAPVVAQPAVGPKSLSLAFYDQITGNKIRELKADFPAPGGFCSWWHFISYVPPFYFFGPLTSELEARAVRDYFDSSISAAMATLGVQAARDPLLMDFPNVRRAVARAKARGDEAMLRGRVHDAFLAYNEALSSVPESLRGTWFDEGLLESYLSAGAKSGAFPPVPAEARQHAMRAQAMIKLATKPEDFVSAADEMQEAVKTAPWWARAYYDLGLIQEMAKRYKDASRSLKLYLTAVPDAPQATAVRAKIVELEVADEQAQKAAASAGGQ